jgi:hypothetical protein
MIGLVVKVQEFDLVCNMLIVAVEEHYKDAGQLLLICMKETVIHLFVGMGIPFWGFVGDICNLIFCLFQLNTDTNFHCCGPRKRTHYNRM